MIGFLPIGDHRDGIVIEELWNVLFIMLDLVEGILDRGIFVEHVFKLKHHQRQAIDKDDEIWTALVFAFDGKLVDAKKIVVLRMLKVYGVQMGSFVFFLFLPRDVDAHGDLAMDISVSVIQVLSYGMRELNNCFFQLSILYKLSR